MTRRNPLKSTVFPLCQKPLIQYLRSHSMQRHALEDDCKSLAEMVEPHLQDHQDDHMHIDLDPINTA